MFKKLTFAAVSVLMLGTASVATAAPRATVQSAPVALHQDSHVTRANQENWWAVDSADRASSPYSDF